MVQLGNEGRGLAGRRFLLGLLVLVSLGGCPGPREAAAPLAPTPASPQGEKQELLRILRSNYLWSANLPDVDPAAFRTPKELLEHQTRSASGGLDTWTRLKQKTGGRLVTLAADPDEPGFGFTIALRDRHRVLVREVLPGSPAAGAGLRRGDEVLQFAETLEQLQAANRSPGLNAVLAAGGWVVKHPDPRLRNRQRCFRIRQAGTGEVVDRLLTQATVPPDPGPGPDTPPILPAGPDRKVGYLLLREFSPAARPGLRKAVAHFARNSVTDLIVDLRYNSGGDEETLVLLVNLLGAGVPEGTPMLRMLGNGRVPDRIHHFRPEPGAIRPERIAFVVTRETASSSEAAVIALLPHYRSHLALVGEATHGKPVGGTSFELTGSPLVAHLMVYRVTNADGLGDYYRGLPTRTGFDGATVQAEDDLAHAPGDPAEASTAAALRWIQDGSSDRGPIPPN